MIKLNGELSKNIILNKKFYIDLLRKSNKKDIENIINYLRDETDFFIAPASSNYHGNYYGGLTEHSLIVYLNMLKISCLLEEKINKEEIIIIALLHDICKCNFYENSIRNKKIDGHWIQEPYFSINDDIPLGHGEKSALILQKFIKLTDNELFAIRWHMMSYDDIVKGYAGNLSLTNALNKYPIISLIHISDLMSISLNFKNCNLKNIINYD